jgi:Fe-S-cluster containining protein
MKTSCLRCGRCCTQFGVCVTFADVKRICKETGEDPEDFLDYIREPPIRERKEPAIKIDGESCLLVLKRKEDNVCPFYNDSGCVIYENRPMLCRSYPFRSKNKQLAELESRECPKKWLPEGKEKEQYLADCKQYEKEVAAYKQIAEKWNKLGGSFRQFLDFILDQ